MSQTAVHLVDNVIPHVLVRQRVLTWVIRLPIPLRLLLAAQPKLVRTVMQAAHRVMTRRLLNQTGLKPHEADSGAVSLIQRFGSAKNVKWTCIAWCWTACTGAAPTARRSSLKCPRQMTQLIELEKRHHHGAILHRAESCAAKTHVFLIGVRNDLSPKRNNSRLQCRLLLFEAYPDCLESERRYPPTFLERPCKRKRLRWFHGRQRTQHRSSRGSCTSQ